MKIKLTKKQAEILRDLQQDPVTRKYIWESTKQHEVEYEAENNPFTFTETISILPCQLIRRA